MDLKALTCEMNRFVEAKGWYAPNSPRPQTPRNLATSMAIEAAEVLEHFQWSEVAASGVEDELADVALYLLQLAHRLGIDLEAAILAKLNLNSSRRWDG